MTSLSCFRSLRRTLSVLVVGSLATAGLLAATPTASSAVTTVAASAAASTGISVAGLTTNGRTDPLGIPGAAPSFGWKSSSERRGVTQTAYEIQVGSSAGADDVWSSGKVVSDEQADVAYAGPDLTSGTRYYWRVRVWDDQDTASDWSDPAWFETGLLTAADWGSAAWVGKPAPSYSSWTDYTVTESFKLNAVAFGTFLHATDVKNTYMWQINVGSTASATPQLVPHVEVNGTYTVLPAVDLTTFGFTRAGLLSGTHTVSYQLSGTTVTTTLDGVVVDTRTVATYGSGRVGIRTYGSESVTISQLKVVKADGTALADPSFAASNPLSGGSIANGAVTVSGTVDSLLTGAENNEPLLRKTFATTTGKTVESARVYASAHGVYQLSLNGHKVGDQFLAPGYTEYDKRIQSQTYDVTDLVRDGANGFGAELGDGWWAGKVGLAGKYQYGTDLALVARLRITYTDGSTQWVDTDSSWTWANGPFVATDNQLGETYDARFEQAGWDTGTFDDSTWSPVTTVASDTAKLSPQPDEPVRQTGTVNTKAVTSPAPGVQIYDLGQNMVGVARVTITGKAGETVKLRHAEVLNPDGTMYVANLRNALATDYYTFAKDGTITYQPTFTQHGFRYIEISGLSTLPSAADVKGIVLGSDLTGTGSLSTSNTMLNQLLSNIRWGARGNFLSIPTDTPARDERLGWTGDINIFSPTASYLFDMRAFLGKWMQDVRDEQKSDGQIPAVVPSTKGAFADSGPGWEDAIVAVPYALYRAYGDLSLVRDNWADMEKFYDFAAAKIGTDNLGAYSSTFFTTTDWLSLDDSSGASNDVKTTAIWADTVRMMAEMATALGDPRAAEFEARYAQIKKDFVAAFVNSDGTISGGAQTVYAMALGMGLIDDPALKKKVGDQYVAKLAQSDNHLQTGFIGTPWLLPALTNIGRDDLAYTLLLKTDYPSWGYEISRGATTVWERWNSIQPDGSFGPVDMNSFNHYAYGAVEDWMDRNIGGIQIKDAGYHASIIEPHPSDQIDHANGAIDTVYGDLTDSWKTTDSGMTLDVTVPVNTTSEIRIPATSTWAVTEGGTSLDQVDGVESVSYDAAAKRVVVTVGSGTYHFTANDAMAPSGAIMDALGSLSDSIQAANGLTDEQRTRLSDDTDTATADVRAALTAIAAGDTTTEPTRLGEALNTLTATQSWLSDSGVADPAGTQLATQLNTVVRKIRSRISSITGFAVAMPAIEVPVAPGDVVHGTITITNGSDSAVSSSAAEITVPGLSDDPIEVTGPALAAGAQGTVAFDLPTPSAAKVGTYDADADVTLSVPGHDDLEQSAYTSDWVTVATDVAITGATATYASTGLANVAVTVTNTSGEPVSGRISLSQPAGWPASTPSKLVVIAAGGSAQIQLPMYVKPDADAGGYAVQADFVDRGTTLATSPVTVTVPALTLPPTEAFSDYVDFGDTTSEDAHAIAASPTSGISTEAGYTRRYSHNNTPGSWYSADVAVPAHTPFLLRMRETWNSTGTKDYNVYVNGVLLKRVNYSKTGGGVTQYELAVTDPAMLDDDGTVTVKFEYPSDDAALQYYDPSIADLWAIPMPDDLAPTISASTGTDPKVGNNGWYRAPVKVTVEASDNDDAQPQVEYRSGQDWTSYAGPVTVSDDGRHTVDYRATDAAGNTATDSLSVDIDATPPTVAFVGGPSGDVAWGSVPASPTCSASDVTSGLASCVVTGYSTAMGAHTLKATATDLAGNTASVTQHYTVVKADQTISITAPGTAAFGDPNVTVSASSTSGLPVSLTAQGACSLDGTHLSMTGVGDCVLTGSQDGNDNYNPAQRTLTIDVGRGSQTLTIDAPQTATYGQADFPITVTASSGLPAAVVGSGACTVTDGTVHVIAAGACLISASQAGNDTYNPAPDVTRTIQVGKAAQSVRLDAPSRVTYGVGTFAITADASSGLKVALSADGACTISGGIVRVVGVGTCRIVATQGGNEDYQAAPTVVRNVTVDPAPLPATHVTVKGKVKVGKRLTAKLAIPAGATVRYQWLAGKKVIKGATKATLKLKKGLLGKKIKVRVTVSLDGYQTTTVVGVKAKKVKR